MLRNRNPLALTILSLLAAATAVVFGLRSFEAPQPASAAGAILNLPTAVCNGASATAGFNWTPVPGATEQWLDLSLGDNGFQAGTFVTSGKLAGTANAFIWPGLQTQPVHYWRVNALTAAGWVPSATGAFVPCGGPVLLWGPITCNGTSSATLDFHWAPASNAQLQYLDLGFDPNFAPGSYAGAGPLSVGTGDYHWEGLQTSVQYYFRVNALGSDGVWRSTSLGNFVACGAPATGPVLIGNGYVNPDIYGSNDVLVIQRLGIQAPVNVRDVGADGRMGDPAGPNDVVRYNFPLFGGVGGYPGAGGTTVVAGHVDYHPNLQAVFWYLRDIRPGDIIEYYRADGGMVQYQVNWAQQIPPSYDFGSLIASTNPESLVIITCDGVFNSATHEYDQRLVAEATRIN